MQMMMEFRVVFLIWFFISWASVTTTVTKQLPQVPTDGALLASFTPRSGQEMIRKPEVDGEEAAGNNLGWSAWSEWSTCSRSCDRGISHQERRCHSPIECQGDTLRHKICNMQPCPEYQDSRAHQCSAYDHIPYEGSFYKWTPHHENHRPCALTCSGTPRRTTDDSDTTQIPHSSGAEDVGEDHPKNGRVPTVGPQKDEGEDDEASVIVQLALRVQDGTRCRIDSLDMCIQGKCQSIGCDLKIGSTKEVDACGVCGGDSSSCTHPQYHWDVTEGAPCSVTCGGGYKIPKQKCKNIKNENYVDESFCDALPRPDPTVLPCNTHSCPSKWIAEEWSVCSSVCGKGTRERRVVCAEEMDGIRTRIADGSCQQPKLPTREHCNVHACPQWETSAWSGCSVSCGQGIRVRNVECVLGKEGELSAHCDPHTKPGAMQSCATGIPCNEFDNRSHNHFVHTMHQLLGHSSTIILNPSPPQLSFRRSGYSGEEDETIREPEPQPLTQRQEVMPKRDSTLQNVPSEATFILDSEWGPCSVTCGEGVRNRVYRCKIYLEFSKTTPTLNDTLCPGPKPMDEVEKCYLDPCSMTYGYDPSFPRPTHNRHQHTLNEFKVQAAVPGKTYSWHEQGYTSCTASCLGGVEELIINCVRDDTGKVVSPFLCSQETKPETRMRTCNDHQCPPRWNMSEFSPCSKSCGIGIKTREVQCIHEVARGGENTMSVPHSMCPQPIPSDRQYCNVLDCPVRWEVSEWGKCSKNCGGGHKERHVECKQTMAQEHKVERPESLCPGPKPVDLKGCNHKPCAPENQRPQISASNSTYIQHDQRKAKVSLKVGGAAEVFYGVQVKVKCPIRGRFNRTRIHWSSEGAFLVESKRVKVSAKGTLRISNITYRDSGIYTCHAGLSSEQLNVTVKAKVGDNVSVNEYEKYRAEVENRRNNPRNEAPGNLDFDDRGPRDSQFEVSTSESIFTISASSSGSRATPMKHLKTLLSGLQFLLWPFQNFHNSNGYSLLRRHPQYYPKKLSTTNLHFPGHENLKRNQQQRQWSRGFAGNAPPYADKIQTMQEITNNIGQGEAVEELNRLRTTSPVRMKSASNQQQNRNPNNPRRLDWRLGQRINALIESPGESGIVLGEGTATDLKFEWLITPWTECSLPCGQGGFRLRSAYCVVRLNNVAERTENSLCEVAGLEAPTTQESCANGGCASWVAEEWRRCSNAPCLAWNLAVQRRTVYCGLNGTRTKEQNCNRNERPGTQQDCFNEKCKGEWQVENWSECGRGVCGEIGTRTRGLRCVWRGTNKTAGEMCRNLQVPIVEQSCRALSCPEHTTVTTTTAEGEVGEEDNDEEVESTLEIASESKSISNKIVNSWAVLIIALIMM